MKDDQELRDRDRRNEYFELFESAPVGYVILDNSYKIRGINKTARSFLKAGESGLTEIVFLDFIEPGFVESFRFFLKNLKAGKEAGDCWLKLKTTPDTMIFKGNTGGEDKAEKQSIRLVFFPTSGSHGQPHTGRNHATENVMEFSENTVTPEDILKGLTILVVDDDEVARFYLRELLKNKCREILFATNGKEAVDTVETNPGIDLVLMDIKMPVMDGYTATIKIKGNNKNVIVVAQTAYALASDREKALAAGCDDYLAKPLMKKDLFLVIGKFFQEV